MPGVQVTARPAADRWGILLEVGAGGTLGGRPITAWRASTRAALDLPASGPIVAGGHQPVPWHPGILAKRIAVTTLARRTGAVAIDVVIDQHAGDFGLIEVPCRRSTRIRRRCANYFNI